MQCRTHSCGELRSSDVGSTVTMMGWVRSHRDHGHLIFLDLWDHEGITQVVVDSQISEDALAAAQDVRDEYVVAVRGVVRARPEGTENPMLATSAGADWTW